jgi:secreted trypsin-like serine protease
MVTSSNSNQTVRGELPWLVSIYQQTSGSFKFHCAGTLVSNNIVVTAAHCIHESFNKTLGLQEAVLFIGRFDILEWTKRDYETRAVREFIIHQEYKIQQHSSDHSVADIALIVMEQPVEFNKFIQPICLPDVNEGGRINYLLAGWERDEFGAIEHGVPLKTGVPYIPIRNCRVKNRSSPVDNTSIICVGGKNWRGPCNVDSGGAIISEMNQRWYLSGIMSAALPDAGIRFCNLKRYNIFTKVSEFNSWITWYINWYH